MRKTTKSPGEKIVKDIKRATRKHYSSEEKIRIVLDGLRTYAALNNETGDVHVYNTGYLFGEWKDGTTFETNRYMDKFVVCGGKIISTDVWNDSAKIILQRAGLEEAEF